MQAHRNQHVAFFKYYFVYLRPCPHQLCGSCDKNEFSAGPQYVRGLQNHARGALRTSLSLARVLTGPHRNR